LFWVVFPSFPVAGTGVAGACRRWSCKSFTGTDVVLHCHPSACVGNFSPS
jgi:hypothetical protein